MAKSETLTHDMPSENLFLKIQDFKPNFMFNFMYLTGAVRGSELHQFHQPAQHGCVEYPFSHPSSVENDNKLCYFFSCYLIKSDSENPIKVKVAGVSAHVIHV